MIRVGPALLDVDREGRVILKHWRQPDRPGVTFSDRSEWEAFLFAVNGYEAEYAKLSGPAR